MRFPSKPNFWKASLYSWHSLPFTVLKLWWSLSLSYTKYCKKKKIFSIVWMNCVDMTYGWQLHHVWELALLLFSFAEDLPVPHSKCNCREPQDTVVSSQMDHVKIIKRWLWKFVQWLSTSCLYLVSVYFSHFFNTLMYNHGVFSSSRILTAPTPVSYTHLDVYKRQCHDDDHLCRRTSKMLCSKVIFVVSVH